MKIKIWQRPRYLEQYTTIYSNILDRHYVTELPAWGSIEVAVEWNGRPALMRYSDGLEFLPLNPVATRLLKDENAAVRGAAHIVTSADYRFKLRAWATRKEVMDAIENLGLSEPLIIKNFGQYVPQQDIYAATQNDLFAVRMCL